MRPVWEHPFERESVRMLTIGKLAALADVRTDTLRYYERERLLTPAGKSDAVIGSTMAIRCGASASSSRPSIAVSRLSKSHNSWLFGIKLRRAAVMCARLRLGKNGNCRLASE